ncbi:MAG: metallophosphoesterase family protein [Bryobacterales bacterium]|nr:metallophosphoesterase family protein [Bryobacterales bacterium]
MRRLIVSDIHSNLEALEAVLSQAEGSYDEVICCGDVVGYCACPAEVIDWARESVAAIVRGNHDIACCGGGGLHDFNPPARAAAIWTYEQLSEQDRDWLRRMPKGPMRFDHYELAHGSPEDENQYLVSTADVEWLDRAEMRRLCFVGHTHRQGGWSWQRGGIQRIPAPSPKEQERVMDLDPDYQYLINPGSVGQPRDGDPRAGYALWNSSANLLALRRVKYDVRLAQMRIADAGLPHHLAERLAAGH